MNKDTIEKFQSENRPVWVLGMWSAMPLKARIVRISEDSQAGGCAEVEYIYDGKYGTNGFRSVLFDYIYESKEDMIKAMYETVQQKGSEIRASIHTKEDCIRFLFQHNVSCTEETDWTARRAVQEIARERWGMELG